MTRLNYTVLAIVLLKVLERKINWLWQMGKGRVAHPPETNDVVCLFSICFEWVWAHCKGQLPSSSLTYSTQTT